MSAILLPIKLGLSVIGGYGSVFHPPPQQGIERAANMGEHVGTDIDPPYFAPLGYKLCPRCHLAKRLAFFVGCNVAAKRDQLNAEILAYIRTHIPDCAWNGKTLVFT